ncbi:MtrAB system histidine kinase MtrB [Auritidibacter ignavus]|uniref:MtrAB system histidine kinase MtrB n=1 Tax=Auritidibacter ignavus TaxID=678932 RepID=UPI0024BB676F|nr:MtrAB system histidine kinase MtrB [Auritidibacter ignavus]WHS28345.1 MtrAB system histidine kinase MtrB [Auritidibacter ignavus]
MSAALSVESEETTSEANTARPAAPEAQRAEKPRKNRFLSRPFKTFWRRWQSSLQLRTVMITALLSVIAVLILALFLTHQVTTGLFQSRFNQVQAEANHGLSQAREVFDSAATADEESTASLVNDTLAALSGNTSGAIARDFVLVPLDDDENQFVGSMSSAGVSEDVITDDLASQVEQGDGIYWQSVAIPSDTGGATDPGLAFGTQVVLPPGNYYALYFIYDISEVQGTLDYVMSVLLIAGAILILLNVVIAVVTTRSVVRPIQQAAETAQWLSSGDLSVRMNVNREDEVATLSRSFNSMADNIQDQITQLAHLSQIQQRFVSDVSHELRTPLTTVRMAAEVLYDSRDDFDAVNRRSTELLYHQVERFQALLADLLEISRFDAGAAQVASESTDLLHLVADVLLTAQPLADNNQTELSIVPQGDQFTAEVDSRRIERILRNLINNAIEHGGSKPVDVIVAGNKTEIAIVVRDHGLGLSEDELERVFDRFWRADPARTRTTGGSGLGLAIAVEDTRLHHGELDVWGEPHRGAAFRLVLPRQVGGELVKPYPLQLPPEYECSERRSASEIGPGPDEPANGHEMPDRVNEQALVPRSRRGLDD